MIVHYENPRTKDLSQVELKTAWIEQVHQMAIDYRKLQDLMELLPDDQKVKLLQFADRKRTDLFHELSKVPYIL